MVTNDENRAVRWRTPLRFSTPNPDIQNPTDKIPLCVAVTEQNMSVWPWLNKVKIVIIPKEFHVMFADIRSNETVDWLCFTIVRWFPLVKPLKPI